MRTLFVIACLLITKTFIAQDMSLFLTDSLIPKLKVKTRTNKLEEKVPQPYVIDHYLPDGKIGWTETRSPGNGSLLVGTRYYYDSIGQLDSSIFTSFGVYAEKLERSLVINAERKKIRRMITTYRYDKGRKIESTSSDEEGRICFHTRYDPSGSQTDWYNDSGRIFKTTKMTLEAGAIPLESSSIAVKDDGSTSVINETTYSNTYNKKGQLSRSSYLTEGCKGQRRYAYYRNGLVKSKRGDKCASNWRFKYTYY